MNPSEQNHLLGMLTPAERLVAVHLAEGLCNKEIAATLGKCHTTVKAQVGNILRKTKTSSRGRFIAFYYQQAAGPRPMAPESGVART